MSVPLSPPRGMDDILPDEMPLHRRLLETVRQLFRLYGYREVETPTVEYFELFAVKSGEDILGHMYVFKDAHGRQLVLRPEMTAPIARLVAGKLSRSPLPIRLGYIADCYRLDEPQWGRRRRFYHGGFEIFGSSHASADAEGILIFDDFMKRAGVSEYTFKIGHVGVHRAIMSSIGIESEDQDRVLALMDRGRTEEAEKMVRQLSKSQEGAMLFSEVANHKPGPALETLTDIKEIVAGNERALGEAQNLQEILSLATSAVDPSILVYHPGFARGLSYYTGFIFEVYGRHADVALGGGGRYDGLVSTVGGPNIPGVGFAIGLTRVMQYLLDKMAVKVDHDSALVYVVPLSDDAVGEAFKVATQFRRAGASTEFEPSVCSAVEAIRRAERRGARFLAMLGRREIERKVVSVRDLERRVQEEWVFEEVYEKAKTLLKGIRVST
ncbi:MAG: histidine--tRNA ligase [Nitrososphaerota archaeon]